MYYPLRKIGYRPPRAVPAPRDVPPGIGIPVCRLHRGIYRPVQQTFHLLNREVSFGRDINWQFRGFGLLWQFHLYYFDWLKDTNISLSGRLGSIIHFIDNQKDKEVLFSSYTTALRTRNWIIFCIESQISDNRVTAFLFRELDRLSHFPEYEIGGNHLLESGISLVWGGIYFKNSRMLQIGRKILLRELGRQILPDGVSL
ncbi:MAG: heparinase II/III family protein [Chitinophagaceae bacterium]